MSLACQTVHHQMLLVMRECLGSHVEGPGTHTCFTLENKIIISPLGGHFNAGVGHIQYNFEPNHSGSDTLFLVWEGQVTRTGCFTLPLTSACIERR